jgi:hypothetical protein
VCRSFKLPTEDRRTCALVPIASYLQLQLQPLPLPGYLGRYLSGNSVDTDSRQVTTTPTARWNIKKVGGIPCLDALIYANG